jgi:hypothetical protein
MLIIVRISTKKKPSQNLSKKHQKHKSKSYSSRNQKRERRRIRARPNYFMRMDLKET